MKLSSLMEKTHTELERPSQGRSWVIDRMEELEKLFGPGVPLLPQRYVEPDKRKDSN